MGTTLHSTGAVVVGYFATGHAAHRAINALIDEGFQPSEIGAAFHVGAENASTQEHSGAGAVAGSSLREDLGTTRPESSVGPSTTFGAPASDSTAVQPAALGGGSGTPFGGAGRPGPISGSSLANTGLPSDLNSDLEGTSPSEATSGSAYSDRHETSENWSGRLRSVFPQTSDTDRAPKAPVTKESQNFGTGEGHLNLNTRPYSQPAFERSFSNYGLEAGHARSLSRRIGGGGAVVSVHSTSRAAEAERVLEQHGGLVRHTGNVDETGAQASGQVEVFGTLHRHYVV